MKASAKKSGYAYKTLGQAQFDDWSAMVRQLWPGQSKASLREMFGDIRSSPRRRGIVCYSPDGEPAGFIEVSIRTDYVEGSDSSPVGYIEGIFVEKKFRNKGVARALVEEAKAWFRKKGLREMGSDTEIENVGSQRFHQAIGFEKPSTNVHFIKKI